MGCCQLSVPSLLSYPPSHTGFERWLHNCQMVQEISIDCAMNHSVPIQPTLWKYQSINKVGLDVVMSIRIKVVW